MALCGKNESVTELKGQADGIKAQLKGGLGALDDLAAKADAQLGFIEGKLKSQIPKPENLQEKLASLNGLSGLGMAEAVAGIKEKFGGALPDIDSFIGASITDPTAKAAAGLKFNVPGIEGLTGRQSLLGGIIAGGVAAAAGQSDAVLGDQSDLLDDPTGALRNPTGALTSALPGGVSDLAGGLPSGVSGLAGGLPSGVSGLAGALPGGIPGAPEVPKFDICAEVPNLELKPGTTEVVEKALVAKTPNVKNEPAPVVVPTLVAKEKEPSQSGSGVSNDAYTEALTKDLKAKSDITSAKSDVSFYTTQYRPALDDFKSFVKRDDVKAAAKAAKAAGFGGDVRKYVESGQAPDNVAQLAIEGRSKQMKVQTIKKGLIDLGLLYTKITNDLERGNSPDRDKLKNDVVKNYANDGEGGKAVADFTDTVLSIIEKTEGEGVYTTIGKYKNYI